MNHYLRRLRLNGLIHRFQNTNRYLLTAEGCASPSSTPRPNNRLLVPLTAANQAQAPHELRALAAITRHVGDYASRARLPRAA
jgi:hypothetical protein